MIKTFHKKKIIIFSIILIALLSICYKLFYENHYKIIWKNRYEKEVKIHNIESSFNKNPNALDAYQLVEYYLGEAKYEKALEYGKAFLNLGGQDDKLEGRANFFLARACYELDKLDQSRIYLKSAFSYCPNKEIALERFKIVKKYKMDSLFADEEWKQILAPDRAGQ